MEKPSTYILKIGFVLFALTFLYDCVFVNIPPQDAPVWLSEKYNQKIKLINFGYCLSLFVIVLGVILKLKNSKTDNSLPTTHN